MPAETFAKIANHFSAAMPTPPIIAATDIGTAKVTVFIAEAGTGPGGAPRIIAAGETLTGPDCMKKGFILNAEETCKRVHAAFDAAEKMAGGGLRLKTSFLTLSGSHLVGRLCPGVATVTGSGGTVCARDTARARSEAKKVDAFPKERWPHHVPVAYLFQPYRINNTFFNNPVGQPGRHLHSDCWVVAADRRRMKLMRDIVEQYIQNPEVVVASVASGTLLAGEDKRRNGALVVDIGAGTTDFVLYQRGCVVMTGVLPVGGDHITADLADGLKLRISQSGADGPDRLRAEELKLAYDPGAAAAPDASPYVWRFGNGRVGDRRIPLSSVGQVIRARTDEIFRFVMARVTKFVKAPSDIAAGIIVTGGTAKLGGILDIATQATGLGARAAEFPEWVPAEYARPEHSAALGVLLHAQQRLARRRTAPKRGVLQTLKRWLRF
ncbi:MAG: ethanolamine ammonia-lyase reactivating factor EutA [Puniceicoccales bacterium]|nr:ethanolamine ammonia-lyase reactivating factor EutA [Puniceicoccales bacterium]